MNYDGLVALPTPDPSLQKRNADQSQVRQIFRAKNTNEAKPLGGGCVGKTSRSQRGGLRGWKARCFHGCLLAVDVHTPGRRGCVTRINTSPGNNEVSGTN